MEIGTRLKEAREAKELSLEDLQKITKIQTRYLQAIEKGNFDIMPGKFYVRAFIKEYATAVDLDPELLMEEYKGELPVSSEDSSIQYTRMQRSRKDTSPSKSPAIFSFLPTAIVVLLIVGIIFAVWYFNKESESDNTDEEIITEENGNDEVRLPPDDQNDTENDNTDGEGTTEEEEPEVEEEPTPEQPVFTLTDQGNGEQTYDLTNVSGEALLTLTTETEHWLEVENGKGKSFYNGMFYAKDAPLEIEVTGEEQLYLRFGNPTALDITINGTKLTLPDDIDPSKVQKVWINVQNSAE